MAVRFGGNAFRLRPESSQFAAVPCREPHVPSTGSDLPVTPLPVCEPSHSLLIRALPEDVTSHDTP